MTARPMTTLDRIAISVAACELRQALGEYRLWGNLGVQATTYAAVGAEAMVRLDAIAKRCDTLLDALTGANLGVGE